MVVFAPRRFGKSSLIWRAAQQLIHSDEVLIAQVDLMTAPTRERLAEKLAQSIYDDIASTLDRVRERAATVFKGLRIAPMMTLDPDGSLGFRFAAGHAPEDLDATLEHLLRLPAQLGAERHRRVAVVFDEFQEIVRIDPGLLPLMRSVFQEQPDVAHVYLGSRRQMLESIFQDVNEPFWRSAKQMELGVIAPPLFGAFLHSQFERTGRTIDAATTQAALDITHAHPYGTQELAYALWEVTPRRGTARAPHLAEALTRVLRSEHAHFDRIWERAAKAQRLTLEALAREPGRPPFSRGYRQRHALPATSTVQRALDTLERDELIERHSGGYRISEPFLAEWILRSGV